MIDPKLPTVALLFFSCVSTSHVLAQSDLIAEPYTVYVAEDGGYARCGPSNKSYPTDPLHHRQPLKVFVETNDGWLGIQPVDDSFCWVPADVVDLDRSNKSGSINEDRTPAWIGTHVEQQPKNQWQVQLAAGEKVTVIGQSQRQGPDGPQLWYRIVPPSGEYRWVHKDQVIRGEDRSLAVTQLAPQDKSSDESVLAAPRSTITEPESLADAVKENGLIALFGFARRDRSIAAADNASPLTQASDPVRFSNAPQRAPFSAPPSSSVPTSSSVPSSSSVPTRSSEPDTSSWVATMTQGVTPANTAGRAMSPIQSIQPIPPIQQASFQQAPLQPLGWQGRVGDPAAYGTAASAPAIIPAPTSLNDGNAANIAQIEMEVAGANLDQLSIVLSKLMSREASAVETQPVIRATRNLSTGSPDSMNRANQLAERAEQYAQFAMRRDAAKLASGPIGSGIPTAQMSTATVQPIPNGFQNPTPADVAISGYLVPVYSARADSPPLALTDGKGRTIAYVTPSPGINLRGQINTNVRVSGKQTFVTGLSTPVIVAINAVTIH